MRQNNDSKFLLLKEEKLDPRKILFSENNNESNKENNYLNSNIIISNTLLDSLCNNQENIPVCILFKNSLAKSGYKLTPEQSVLYKDAYKKHNSINSKKTVGQLNMKEFDTVLVQKVQLAESSRKG